jgi:heptose I phosphotransferase
MHLRPDFQKLFSGSKAFDEILNAQGEVFREHKNRRTIRITRNGQGYFIKIHRRIGWQEIFKNLLNLRMPVLGAMNELKAIRRLEALGIKTMQVVGFGERGVPPAWLDSFLITEELEHTISLENLGNQWKSHPPPFTLKQAIIHKVAEISRLMHENGINHRDFYICHFLLDIESLETFSLKESHDRGPDMYLIDLHRVQLRKRTPNRWIIKDLAGLLFSSLDIGLTRRDMFRFMKAYRRKPLQNILKDEERFWQEITRRAERLYRKEQKRLPGFQQKTSGDSPC